MSKALMPGTKDTTRGTRKAVMQVCNNSDKWHFKVEWCSNAGLSPYNDLYWELAERAYAQRYFDCSPASDISLKMFQENSH